MVAAVDPKDDPHGRGEQHNDLQIGQFTDLRTISIANSSDCS